MRRTFTLALFILINIHFLNAQEVGSVRGFISDSSGALTGASVFIVGSTIGTITDSSGAFMLSNIPAGKQTLGITFLGYIRSNKEIRISQDTILDLGNLLLAIDAKNLKEVTVSGTLKNGSEKQAISMTQTSQRVVTIISSENIKRLPDKDAADALKRVAGVAIQNNKGEGGYVSLRGTPKDWTSTLINGDRLPVADEDNTSRSFEFEVLPADLIDRIDVTRTVTPDLEGDNIGGSINFILKEPVLERTFMINSAIGLDLASDKPQGNINVLYGDVTKNKKFRFVINLSFRERFYQTDAFKLIYGNNFNHAINRYELRDYSGNRTNFGGNTGFDWLPTSKLKFGFKAMTGIMMDDKYKNTMAYTYASSDGQTVQPQFTHGLLNRQLFGGELNAEVKPNDKWKISMKYSGYYNRFFYGSPNQQQNNPADGYFTVAFNNVNPAFRYYDISPILQNGQKDPNNGLTGVPNPSWGASKLIGNDNPWGSGNPWTNIQPQYNFPITSNSVSFLQAYSQTNYTYETDPAVLEVDAKYKMNKQVTFQFGAKGRYKQGARELSYHLWTQNFNNGQNTTTYYLSDFQTTPSRWSSFLPELGSNYGNLSGLANMTRAQLNNFIPTMNTLGHSQMLSQWMDSFNQNYFQWVGSSYDYIETQAACYGMADANIGKWNLVGGLRLEYTHLYEHALSINYNATTRTGVDPHDGKTYNYLPIVDSFTRLQYLAVLPSLNANFNIDSKSKFRMAASRTFHRQNFQETKPGAALIDFVNFLYIKGNPYLKPTYGYNLDMSYQYFWGSSGLITITAYGKYIYDHIFVESTGGSDPLTLFITKTYKNVPNSYVGGLELEFKKKFDFLPRFASGFGIQANITGSLSHMEIPGRPSGQAMSEQSPLLYNLALTYEKYGIKSSLALNYNSPFLLELNLATLPNSKTGALLHQNSDFDTYMGEQYSMDFQISYEFKKHFSVYFEANNLLNSAYKQYIGNPDRPLFVEYYKQRGQVGFKYEL